MLAGAAMTAKMMRRVSSDTGLDFHDFCFLRLQQLIDLADVVVVELLKLFLGPLLLVCRRFLELLQLIARGGSRVADADPRLLGQLVNDLDQLLSALLVERRERDPDDARLRLRIEPEIRLTQRLFDRRDQSLVPRRHGEEPWLWRRHARHLIQRHLLAVSFNAYRVEQARRRLAGSNGRQLALRRLERFLHRGPAVLRDLRNCRHCTIVPTRSPKSAFATSP